MCKVYQELCRLRDGSNIDERLIAKIELLSDPFAGIGGKPTCQLDKEDEAISEFERS